jgi:hypothetical protein
MAVMVASVDRQPDKAATPVIASARLSVVVATAAMAVSPISHLLVVAVVVAQAVHPVLAGQVVRRAAMVEVEAVVAAPMAAALVHRRPTALVPTVAMVRSATEAGAHRLGLAQRQRVVAVAAAMRLPPAMVVQVAPEALRAGPVAVVVAVRVTTHRLAMAVRAVSTAAVAAVVATTATTAAQVDKA